MLDRVARGIEHYGSTAVPGLPAKPILDILVGVLPLADWTKCQALLLALGDDGTPGHHIFGRGRDPELRARYLSLRQHSVAVAPEGRPACNAVTAEAIGQMKADLPG